MKFNVYWKNIKFLEVEKINNMYYSKVIGENMDKVEKEGFPITFLSSIKSMDGELPKIIQSRLPKIEYISEKIEDTSDVEKSIIEYINKTKCQRVTDFITMDIEA